MGKTQKARKGPLVSATAYSVGTVMKGANGTMWEIRSTKTGVHRWIRTEKKAETRKVSSTLSTEALKKLKEKYKARVSGSKTDIARALWRSRSNIISNEDLALLLPLLTPTDRKAAKLSMEKRANNPITNYKGMWTPQPKPLNQMSREELTGHLRKFRNAWEKITTRDTDLSDERLQSESTKELRGLLKFYYTENAKTLAEDWLR
jgi:hypothetical protein